jgi:hypothetical protein
MTPGMDGERTAIEIMRVMGGGRRRAYCHDFRGEPERGQLYA